MPISSEQLLKPKMPVGIAKDVSAVLETQRRLVETVTLEQRIAALEVGLGGKK